MSDTALEALHEQELREQTYGKVGLYVDGRLHMTFPNDAVGNRQAEKVAWKASEIYDDVRVEPMGRGGSGRKAGDARDSDGTRAAAAHPQPRSISSPLAESIARHPANGPCIAGSRRCKPSISAGPSGKRLRHSFDCPDHPGEPIPLSEYAGQGRRNPTPWRDM